MSISDQIKSKALDLGFDVVGITDASPIAETDIDFLTQWLQSGYAGQMQYIHRNFEKRTNPSMLLEDAKSVICLGLNYKPDSQNFVETTRNYPTGRIARYAQYEDYHVYIKQQLRKLIELIESVVEGNFRFKLCVDSVPLAERALAVRAGLGFIGKNHMLINPEFGPEVFLAEIVTDLELDTDKPMQGDCSGCEKCIKACPTGALREDRQFDASRCISYLTIECKDELPNELAKLIGDRLFGCDECVLVCPLQRDAPVCSNEEFRFYEDRDRHDLDTVLAMTEEEFESEFGDSPLKRLGLEGLKRNAREALENSQR
jgi:epoxyqueuosine reductase